jgi:hypothetical protein
MPGSIDQSPPLRMSDSLEPIVCAQFSVDVMQVVSQRL